MSASDATVLRISDEKTLELVELYKKEQCLWDTSLPDYKIKMKRREAAEKIARILNVPNFEPRHVMTKFRNLRNAYCQELKRIAIYQNLNLSEDCNQSRKGKLKAPWYAVMDTFIRPHLQTNYSRTGPTLVINGGIIKREPEPGPAEDPDDLWENSDSEDLAHSNSEFDLPRSPDNCSESGDICEENHKRAAAPSQSNSPKRQKSKDILAESLKEVSTQLEVLKDENLAGTKAQKSQIDNDYHDNFGRYVASLLRLLPKRKSLSLQPKIVNMIVTEVLEEQDEDYE